MSFEQIGNFDLVELVDATYLIEDAYVGEPQLPVKYFNLLLPAGSTATNSNITVGWNCTGNISKLPVNWVW